MIAPALIICRVNRCKEPVAPESVVCAEHDDQRCSYVMPTSSNRPKPSRCRSLVKDGDRCFRHRGES